MAEPATLSEAAARIRERGDPEEAADTIVLYDGDGVPVYAGRWALYDLPDGEGLAPVDSPNEIVGVAKGPPPLPGK